MKALFKDILRPAYHYIRNKNQRVYTSLLSAYSADQRFTPRTMRFSGYTIDVADSISVIHQFKEIFLDEAYKFKTNKESPLIYDCGANVGLSIIYFKQLYPRSIVKGFEADPRIFTLLQKNIQRNVSQVETVELINKAVWIHDRGVEFNQEGADGGNISTLGGSSGSQLRIESAHLRSLLEKESPDFLKMDIEGAELEVLKDCQSVLSGIQGLFVEYHSRPDKPQELNTLLSILTGAGFRYYIQSPMEFKAPFELPWKDSAFDLQLNLFCYR